MPRSLSTAPTKVKLLIIPLLLLAGLLFAACSLAVRPSYPGLTWQVDDEQFGALLKLILDAKMAQ